VETPSFTFRLDRVKWLRERAEAHAREDLARQLALRIRGEALLRRAADAASTARDTGRDTQLRPGASGADLIAAQQWIEQAERRRREAALELDRREAEVAARRSALTEAARERQVIGRLEERQRAAHDREAARVAQIGLDEIALNVHRRKVAA
jgi:flagellar FliJ protein